MSNPKIVKPIHLVCSNDELRPALSCVRIKDGYAIATNGHMIVKQSLEKTSLIHPDEVKKMEGKLIHKNVWKELFSAFSMTVRDGKMVAVTDAGEVVFSFIEEQTLFPDIETVLDKHEEKTTKEITLNPAYITVLGKVFDSYQLRFSFNGKEKGCMVYPLDSEGECAILMPQMSLE